MKRLADTAIPWNALLSWYRENRRAMPWRGKSGPYEVWVSEIMLQQTRVDTVRGYYDRFLAAFPTPRALAEAPEEDVLKMWEGLGYYSRARNLRKAAALVVQADAFPTTAADWAALPGVGAYTAAAVASICFGEPTPVVDGNVTRVVMRLRALPGDGRDPATRKRLAAWIRPAILAAGAPGDFNQAIMELGETLCTPTSPACDACPLRAACRARVAGHPEAFPAKPAKKKLPVRSFLAFRIPAGEGRVWLRKRTEGGLLSGLWELPMVSSGKTDARAARAALATLGFSGGSLRKVSDITHDFSHFRQCLCVWDVRGTFSAPTPTADFSPADWSALPVATASRRALERPS